MNDIKNTLEKLVKNPITVNPNTTLVKIRETLLENKVKRVIVTDKQKPIGIITEKDIAKKIYESGARQLKSIKAKEFKPRKLFTLYKDSSVGECARLMKKHRINSVIIVNDNQTIEGMVTKTDLLSVFLKNDKLLSPIKISKIMTKKLITVTPSDPILYVESLLLKYGISRIIVKRDQMPIGMITFRDFVPAKIPRWIAESADPKEVQEYKMRKGFEENQSNQLSYLFPFHATDIMTPNPITIEKDQFVRSSVLLMIKHGIGGLPVLSRKKLVGIVTKSDIVSLLAK